MYYIYLYQKRDNKKYKKKYKKKKRSEAIIMSCANKKHSTVRTPPYNIIIFFSLFFNKLFL